MRKLLLTAAAAVGLLGLAATEASAAPTAAGLHAAPAAHAQVTPVGYWYHHHYYQHRHWNHNHWHYW